ncbi:hypothetical protein HPB49_022194 [Dermacentor silvarum]|uniref:Uncharacterized protein n=1 Tax=Dermacentor silvarum TaxID=543639 RepID=A0ACB8E2Q5_DERSI|nr:hypothetical protein HPB49_022194 [Dermacentor silvarum]
MPRCPLMFFYIQPKFLDSIEMRRFGLPEIEKLFTCHMSSPVEACQTFDCRSSIKLQFLRTPANMCFTVDPALLARDHVFFKCNTPWMYADVSKGEENKDTFWEFSDATAETPTAAPAASEAAPPVRRYPVRNRRAPDRYTPS